MKERYAGSSLDVNVCHLGEENGIPYAEFEFVPGRPLSELMDECLDGQDVRDFTTCSQSIWREWATGRMCRWQTLI